MRLSDKAHSEANALELRILEYSSPNAINIISVLPNSFCISSQIIFDSMFLGNIFIISSSIMRYFIPREINKVTKIDRPIVRFEWLIL
jgi:hypothetical protein